MVSHYIFGNIENPNVRKSNTNKTDVEVILIISVAVIVVEVILIITIAIVRPIVQTARGTSSAPLFAVF